MTEVIEKTENKKGYKKTKLGWIPEDWNIKNLELACEIITDYVAAGSFADLKAKVQYNDKQDYAQVIRTVDIKNKFKNKGFVYINKEAFEYLYRVNLNEDSIILPNIGANIGECYLLRTNELPYKNNVLGPNAILLKTKQNNINYIYQYCTSEQFKKDLFLIMGASGQPKFNKTELKKISISFPMIKEEQEKIAEILSAWDDGIETLEKLIEQKEIFHKALMKNLLIGKIRLSEFSSKWIHSKFNSVFERITRKNEELNSNILTISAQNGLISQKDFYNKRIASVDTLKYILLKNGEFAYNKSYSNGYPLGAIKRLDLYEKGVVSSLYICFKLNNSDSCSDFWKYYFEAGMLNREIKIIAQEGARNHGLLNMATEDFFNMLLFYPKNIKEQQKIADILNKSEKEIQLLNSKLEKLKEQKKGLMQKLLTGQIRVKI